MKNQPFRMLCLFDYGKGVNTGYATVSRNLVKEWKKYYGNRLVMDIVAINYYGEPYFEDERTAVDNAYFSQKAEDSKDNSNPNFPTNIKTVQGEVRNDEFGRLKFLQNLSKNDYDLVFIINDLGIGCSMAKAIQQIKETKRRQNRKSFKTVFYFPVDSHVFPLISYGLEVFDRLVAYTEFGRKEIIAVRPKLLSKLSVVPHGTNLKDFYPIEDKNEVKKFRREYFGENADKYIVGNINRNQPRKDIPTTILAFMRFKEQHPDSLLYLHMNPKDPLGYDLHTVLSQTPLEEGVDVMFPPKDEENHGSSVYKLNMIYNSIDCYLTTNRGEGYGLTVSESMRCKVPIIAPLHTSIEEMSMYGKNIWGIQDFDFDCNTIDNIIRYKCKEEEVADLLEEVYSASEMEKDAKVNAAYNFISSITWESSARKFIDIFNQLL